MYLLHLLPPSAVRAGRGPLCQPHPPWDRCPPAPHRTSGCPVGWVRCMMRTHLFALKNVLDSLQGFPPSSGTKYKSHKSYVEVKASLIPWATHPASLEQKSSVAHLSHKAVYTNYNACIVEINKFTKIKDCNYCNFWQSTNIVPIQLKHSWDGLQTQDTGML